LAGTLRSLGRRNGAENEDAEDDRRRSDPGPLPAIRAGTALRYSGDDGSMQGLDCTFGELGVLLATGGSAELLDDWVFFVRRDAHIR
jgi:hypothetical protein